MMAPPIKPPTPKTLEKIYASYGASRDAEQASENPADDDAEDARENRADIVRDDGPERDCRIGESNEDRND